MAQTRNTMTRNAINEIIISFVLETPGKMCASCMNINGIHRIKKRIETTVLTKTSTVAFPVGTPA